MCNLHEVTALIIKEISDVILSLSLDGAVMQTGGCMQLQCALIFNVLWKFHSLIFQTFVNCMPLLITAIFSPAL